MFEKEKVKLVEDIFQQATNGDIEKIISELDNNLTTDLVIKEILKKIIDRDLGFQNKITYLLDNQLEFYDKMTIKKLLTTVKGYEQQEIKEIKKPKILRNEKKYKEFAEKFYKLGGKIRLEKIDEILRLDIHGEQNNRRLYYFLNLSNYAKRLRTLVVVRAASSAGKNYLVENTLKLFPEEDIEVYSSATAAVFNYENLGYKKTIFLKEMRESENSEEIFKSLIDGDRTHKEVVREKGKNVVVNHYLESLGIVTTLSFENVAIDLVNRSWVITIDMSSSQTREISVFKRKKKRYQIEIDLYLKKIEEDRDLIKYSYGYLNWDYEVIIPYIEKLSILFPKTPKINIRRDEDKLYNLIEIITIFNQKNRREIELKGKKYLFSEFEDLEIALDIAQEIYIDLILHIDEVKRKIIKYFDFNEKCTRTAMHINLKKEYSHDRKTSTRKMEDLVFEGYLNKEKNSNTWYYTRIDNIDLIEKMHLEHIKEEIDKCVDEMYKYYDEISIDSLETESKKIVKDEILKKEKKREVEIPKTKKKGIENFTKLKKKSEIKIEEMDWK